MRVLAEVIGGAQSILTIGGNPSIPELAALAADSDDRSLLGDDGEGLAWILYVPNGKGGFAPASRTEVFSDIDAQESDQDLSGTFAGPGESDGEDYAFRIRLFVPSPRPAARPTDSGPVPIDDDEDVIDLTNIDIDSGDLVGLRRVRKKRRRKRPGEATDPGRPRRRRPTGEHPALRPEDTQSPQEIAPAPAMAGGEEDRTYEFTPTDSPEELTFSEGVAFSAPEPADDPGFELTIGDGTFAPTDSPGGDDMKDSSFEAAVTAAAIPAVSRPEPPDDLAPEPDSDNEDNEDIVIGAASLDHEDVELSIPQDTLALGTPAPVEPPESLEDGPPTQPQVAPVPAPAPGEPEEADSTVEVGEADAETADEAVAGEAVADEAVADEAVGDETVADEAVEADAETETDDGLDQDDAEAACDPDSEESDAMATVLDAKIATRAAEPGSGADALRAADSADPTDESPKKKKRRRRRKKKPPPPSRKAPLVATLVLLAAACAGLAWLLQVRGVI